MEAVASFFVFMPKTVQPEILPKDILKQVLELKAEVGVDRANNHKVQMFFNRWAIIIFAMEIVNAVIHGLSLLH